MGSPMPMRLPLVVLLLLGVVSLRVRAGKVATELVKPDFTASYLLFIDTYGVFLASTSGAFQAVVYNPASQQDRYYLAVLHAPSKTCVWVANRAVPITDRAAPLHLTARGISVEDPNGTVVWSTPPFGAPVAALRLDNSGNLALLDGRNATLWQSFDRPTDSIVSSQRLPVGGILTSAASDSDLSEGDYRLNVTAADAVLTWMGSLYWRLSNDVNSIKDHDGAVAYMAVNGTGLYLFAADGGVVIQVALPAAELRIVKLGYDGKLLVASFASANSSSTPMGGGFEVPSGGCDLPLSCGALGLCTPKGCTCPPLFAASHDSGCAPSNGSTVLSVSSCGDATGGRSFPVSYVSLGNGVTYYAIKFAPPALAGDNISSCQELCTSNCACLGYFYDDSSLSCYLVLHQLGSFINTNSTGGSDKLGYIKVQSSQAPSSSNSSSSNSTLIAILLPTIIAFVLIVVVSAVVITSWRKERRRAGRHPSRSRDLQLRRQRSPSDSAHLVREIVDDGDDIVIPGLPTRFTHDEIEDITNSFRIKIGAGGFGAVYKGELPDGSLVAVKKIQGVGMQGKREFCTEIAVIGNIHHINLVRLRGFCTEGQRRLLVYEYMNRGSLDRSLFRPTGPLLEWKERIDVAIGAARGLAYLHFGCDQRIIHCDVKPENILLADGGQVKIADFGLAKLLTPEQSGLFTTMRGTRGYLAPEWLSNAPITDRTDVYSFGMVLLELVRGRKNRSEHVSDVGGGEASDSSNGTTGSSSRAAKSDYFPLAALEGHEARRYAELADPRLQGRVVAEEVERVVKVALCCLHEDPHLRPSMAVVAGMLEGTMELWEPRVQSLGFLRLYGRGFTGPADGGGSGIKLNQMWSVGDRSGTTSLTTMSGWPSYMSSSQLSGPR
ncbi:G-type lectin S-receptor-like serine/threonine-protein kinase At5g35370 [Phragmites australis]|uniref:G-type lectin S-receptor-like serine/threonine-protein kinase At5g35370 n=1 Tax=Phragmites australis TaxID=29695 RepID=UPI002D76A7EA|nr:G-type lectin S-receptor-like serine/threonine-protein kinase At5g35370 [Phragmites australis]